jgi:hypothetical protein
MHFKVRLKCFDAVVIGNEGAGQNDSAGVRWLRARELPTLPASSPQRRIAATLLPPADRQGRRWD